MIKRHQMHLHHAAYYVSVPGKAEDLFLQFSRARLNQMPSGCFYSQSLRQASTCFCV